MYRILLIDDALPEQMIVKEIFQKTHFVSVASTLAEGRNLLANQKFDLLLLDIQLPDGDGFKFLASLRSDPKFSEVPVLLLTGRGDVQDKVLGFSLGAEDYLVKPFEPMELRARVEARLKRMKQSIDEAGTFQKGSLRFSLTMQKLVILGDSEKEVDLTPIEFKLLLYLAKHEEHVLSRDQLIEAVWGDNIHIIDRTIDSHISNLRKKISGCEYQIKAVHGVGYAFKKLKGVKIAAAA